MPNTFSGPKNAVTGISPNANENAQRQSLLNARLSTKGDLDRIALIQQFIGGGPFQPGSFRSGGKEHTGFLEQQPTGPLYNLVNRGLQGENLNSQFRQAIAQRQLEGVPENLAYQQYFGRQGLQSGIQGLESQDLLRNLLAGGTFGGNLDLNRQLTGDLSNFFGSGGAASEAQAGNISDVFDAQRQIAASNLGQQFDERMRQAVDSFSNRGLRNTDTPAQELLGRSIDEFGRQATNTEAALSSQQANALLNQPFLQAQLGGQLQGQSNNQLLNLINSFSQPVSAGQFGANSLNNLDQFALQFNPSSVAGPSIQNLMSLIGGANPAPNQPVFSGGVPQTPGFGQTLGQNIATSFGQSLGQGAGVGTGAAIGGLIPGVGAVQGAGAFNTRPGGQP